MTCLSVTIEKYLTILVLLVAVITSAPPEPLVYDSTECSAQESVCSFSLIVEERLTMIAYVPEDKERIYKLVTPTKGRLFRFDEADRNNLSREVGDDKVIQADGYYQNPRTVYVINNQLPAPTIIVYEGTKVRITVSNRLRSDSITIHWHGLHQRGSSYMDGVSYVSQCPILSGQNFLYEFNVQQTGTHWYHAHIGALRTQGLFGALIAREKNPDDNPDTRTPYYPLIINDWNHNWDSNEGHLRMQFNAIYDEQLNNVGETISIDKSRFSVFEFTSGLMNGKGRYRDANGNPSEAPLTVFRVQPEGYVKFGVINAGTLHALRFSIAGHYLIATASDGMEFQEIPNLDSVIIQPGERYDIKIMLTPVKRGNYLIRAETLQLNAPNNYAEAILHYDSADVPDPDDIREYDSDSFQLKKDQISPCSENDPCEVLNCPFARFSDSNPYTICVHLPSLTKSGSSHMEVVDEADVEERFYNFGFPGEFGYDPGAINGRQFRYPNVPIYGNTDKVNEFETSCSKQSCNENEICSCTHIGQLTLGKTYRFILTNVGNASEWGHPVHLHGYSFYVLKQVFAEVDYTTGFEDRPKQTSDLRCDGDKGFCNVVTWANSNWTNNPSLQGLNMNRPILKDTVHVPSGGYTVIQFKADNPGIWFMHCHIELHNADGMAMIFVENDVGSLPDGFPICWNRNQEGVKGVIQSSDTHCSSTVIIHNSVLISISIALLLGL